MFFYRMATPEDEKVSISTESDTTYSSLETDKPVEATVGQPENGAGPENQTSENGSSDQAVEENASECAPNFPPPPANTDNIEPIETPRSPEAVNENAGDELPVEIPLDKANVDGDGKEVVVEVPLDPEDNESEVVESVNGEENELVVEIPLDKEKEADGMTHEMDSNSSPDGGSEKEECLVGNVPFQNYGERRDTSQENGETSDSLNCPESVGESSADETPSQQCSGRVPHASSRSTGPAVFLGRSRKFRYMYNEIGMYAKEAFSNNLDVANMEGILNRILSYAPVTKNELYFARTQLEWLLGDEINLGDDSMTESEDSSDEDEASQEDEYCEGTSHDELSTEILTDNSTCQSIAQCFSPGNGHNSEKCSNGSVPPVSSVLKPSPPQKRQHSDSSVEGKPEKRVAVAVPVESVTPNQLKTAMPHSFSAAHDPSLPSLMGYYTFTDPQKRIIELEIHRRNSVNNPVSFISFSPNFLYSLV